MLKSLRPSAICLLLLLGISHLYAQKPSACANSDFSMGDFTNWIAHTSIYPVNTAGSNVGTAGPAYYYNPGVVPGRHTLITTATADPFTCGNLLTLPPNEKTCVRLGNGGIGPWGDGAGYQRDFLAYTFSITPSNPLLIYKYAVVLQDPSNQPHAKSIRPRFIISIKDKNGVLIDPLCGKKEDFADTTVAGFRNCPLSEANKLGVTTPSQGDIVYRAWTTVGVDLRKYVNQSITIEFETWDCGLGAHFGYAYVMARCDSLKLISAACMPNGAVSLTAPDGFAYLWFPSGQTTKTIDIVGSKPGDSVYVELTTISGCKTALGTRIYPIVTKASFHAKPTAVCLHDPIMFTDSSYSYLTSDHSKLPITSWKWRFGDGTGSTLTSPTHLYTKTGTFKVSLIVTNANGCIDSTTGTVNVSPAPFADFSLKNACVNNLQTLQDLSTSTNGKINSWTWTFGDDGTTSTVQQPSHLFKTVGTFPIHLKVITDLGCSDDTTQSITVLPSPLANYTATTVCVGDPTQFTDLSQATNPLDPIKSRIWSFGDASLPSSSPAPSHTYNNPGMFNTFLIVTTVKGCVGKALSDVVVHRLPRANFSATPLCLSTPVEFTDLSTPKDSISQWYWSFNDQSNSHAVEENPKFTYGQSALYKPKLVVHSIYGCIDSITIPVNIQPPPEVSFDANKYQGCKPLCVDFYDYSFSVSDSIKTWNWTFGDGNGSALPSPSHCYPDAGIYTVSLSIETANSCKQNFTWKDMISVYPFPIADFDPSPSSTPESAPLIKFYDKSSGASVWGWDFGDGASGSAILKDTSHLYKNTGTYTIWLHVQTIHGCKDSTSRQIVVTPEWTFFVPNAFTPHNSQGINDGFIGKGTNIKEYEMWIFDRWGNAIYKCNSMDEPWNGAINNGIHGEKLAQEDVYVWKIKIKDCFDQPHHYIGIVTLVK
jgi:gliding motility-associated-like protein